MKYLLPCDCGQDVEIETSQAGQTVACGCGQMLTVPSMLKIKTLPNVPQKKELPAKKEPTPYMPAGITGLLGIGCLTMCAVIWYAPGFILFGIVSGYFLFILLRGLAVAFLLTSVALFLRALARSPLAEDTALRRTFFVLGIALLFPSCILSSYLYEWQPHPRHATLKRTQFSFGSNQRLLHQDSTPIPFSEFQVLWTTHEDIDQMMPMELFRYFQTLESPTFSYNFLDNYESVRDTFRIWVTFNGILYILAFAGIVVSFCMPKQTVVVTGWSGSDWR